MADTLPAPLNRLLATYCNVEAYDVAKLKAYLAKPANTALKSTVLGQLTAALESRELTPRLYESITGEDFDTQAELDARLRQIIETLSATTTP